MIGRRRRVITRERLQLLNECGQVTAVLLRSSGQPNRKRFEVLTKKPQVRLARPLQGGTRLFEKEERQPRIQQAEQRLVCRRNKIHGVGAESAFCIERESATCDSNGNTILGCSKYETYAN